ncbi:hypothetical protein [Anoxybacteroides rupiense]|uniref:hypothetical protein n=1 Tax=Anoxybacteroides rupiense TaxID=311460 RepID=UPI00366B54A1
MKSITQRAIDCRNEDWVGVGKQCNGVLMGIPVWENNSYQEGYILKSYIAF